jgi:hypothetical protein
MTMAPEKTGKPGDLDALVAVLDRAVARLGAALRNEAR